LLAIAALSLLLCRTTLAGTASLPTLIYTELVRYTPGGPSADLFARGAALQLLSGGRKRALAPGLAVSAWPAVSFDGQRVLFAGRHEAGDSWGIYEMPVSGVSGAIPRRITSENHAAIAPLYLPGDRFVSARATPNGYQLFTADLQDHGMEQLTFTPGDHIPTAVLRDGRILFEAPHPESPNSGTDIYAIYTDGSGLETYRCDHSASRSAARELASGDIVFTANGQLARFTSPQAVEIPLENLPGQAAGPVAELHSGDLLLSWRPDSSGFFGLYRWNPAGAAPPERIAGTPNAHAIGAVLVVPSEVPLIHPSGLGDRDGANLLCLSVYTARQEIPAASIAKVRVFALNDAGKSVELGTAPVAPDGSFFVNPPSERAIRFELLDRLGKVVAREQGWFSSRRGEQRVCVGCHAGPERAPDNAVPGILNQSLEPVHLPLK
jgi:hypothetical protein